MTPHEYIDERLADLYIRLTSRLEPDEENAEAIMRALRAAWHRGYKRGCDDVHADYDRAI